MITQNKSLYFKTESNHTQEINDMINVNKNYDKEAPKRQKYQSTHTGVHPTIQATNCRLLAIKKE